MRFFLLEKKTREKKKNLKCSFKFIVPEEEEEGRKLRRRRRRDASVQWMATAACSGGDEEGEGVVRASREMRQGASPT